MTFNFEGTIVFTEIDITLTYGGFGGWLIGVIAYGEITSTDKFWACLVSVSIFKSTLTQQGPFILDWIINI